MLENNNPSQAVVDEVEILSLAAAEGDIDKKPKLLITVRNPAGSIKPPRVFAVSKYQAQRLLADLTSLLGTSQLLNRPEPEDDDAPPLDWVNDFARTVEPKRARRKKKGK
jgi:hypothetical protein